MITLITIILLSMSLLTGLIYVIIQMQSSVDQSYSIDYNKKQLELVTNELASKTLKNGDDYILPQGVEEDGYNILPNWVSNNNDESINGVPFLYCPSPNNGGTFNDTVTTKTSTYDIRTETNAENANIPYIYSSSFVFNDAIAFLISPIGNNQSSPSCEDIVFEDGNYFVQGGQLSALTENNIKRYETSFNKDSVVYIDQVGTTPTQEEILKGDFEINSLELQLNIFKNNNEEELIIYLDSGNYNIENLNTFTSNNSLKNKKLKIIGNEEELPVIENETNNLNLNFENIDISLQNVLFKGDVTLNNDDIEVVNSEVFSLTANNSNVRLEDVLVNSTALDAVNLINSNVTLNERIEVSGGFILNGSNLKTNPSALNEFVLNNVFDIISSDVLVSNTEISFNGSNIENKGDLNIKNSSATSSFTINNGNNSTLNIEDSFSTPSTPITVVDSDKMAYVSGSNSNIASCSGNIFEDKEELTLNESGEVIETTSIKENNAQSWINCNN